MALTTWLLRLLGVGVAVNVLKAVLARLRLKEGEVLPRVTWFAYALNLLIAPSCWLVDYAGVQVPKIGFMLARPLSLEAMKRKAARRTKLSDWGVPGEGGGGGDGGESKKKENEDAGLFPKAYEFAIAKLNTEVSRPSPLGRFITYDYLLRRLESRLRLVAAVAARGGPPKLETAAPVRAPVFVLGLPRCGTTLLHRLLSLDPECQYPRTFELLDPCPPPGRSRRARVAYWGQKLALIKRIVPQIEVIHELGAEEPEECLLSMCVEVPMLPPTFHLLVAQPEVCLSWDPVRMYALHRQQLSLLSLANASDPAAPPRRWCLKCPVHIGYLDALAKVFPDAKVVWTHRDPCAALPSLASLFRTFAEMFQDGPIDLKQLGREQLKFWSTMCRRGRDALAPGGGASALAHAHVRYEDLVADPVETVRGIYASFGWAVPPAFEAAMRAYLAENKAKREERSVAKLKRFHAYSLEEYGLTEGAIRSEMQWYYDEMLAK